MERLINEDIEKQIREVFDGLENPVEVLFFGKKDDCQYCAETRQLLEEVTALSDKLYLSTYDLEDDAPVALQYRVDKAPTFVITARIADQAVDYGIRYAGIPAGHEFTALINSLVMVSHRSSGLSQATKDYLQGLKEPLHLQVFVTPTCPYCPRAVVLAHQMAMENELIQAEAVEAMEFVELADTYEVSGVPHTTINAGAGNIIGAVPEQQLLDQIRRVVEVTQESEGDGS